MTRKSSFSIQDPLTSTILKEFWMIARVGASLHDHPSTVKIIELFVGHSDLFYFQASLALTEALIYTR
jgi:hypothetical protein